MEILLWIEMCRTCGPESIVQECSVAFGSNCVCIAMIRGKGSVGVIESTIVGKRLDAVDKLSLFAICTKTDRTYVINK